MSVTQTQVAGQVQAPQLVPLNNGNSGTVQGSMPYVDPTGQLKLMPNVDPNAPEPVVTKGFCKEVLKKVENKEAPYYIEGKFTGEARTNLLQQCGRIWCGWALEYKSKAKLPCPQCPEDCTDPNQYITKIMADPAFLPFAGNVYQMLAQEEAPTGPAANDPRDPEFHGNQKNTLIPQPMPTGMFQPPGGPQPAIGGVGPSAATPPNGVVYPNGIYGATGGGGGGYAMVRQNGQNAMCQGVLDKVAKKQAPYWVEGQITNECRQTLTQQCGSQLCQWGQIYGQVIQSCGSECPKDCSQPGVYVQSLMKQQNFQPFMADVYNMVVVRLPPPQQVSTGPPRQVIVPASASNIRGPPAPNDPRDKAYQDEADKVVRVTGRDPNGPPCPNGNPPPCQGGR